MTDQEAIEEARKLRENTFCQESKDEDGCTRVHNHTGEHIAVNFGKVIRRWDNIGKPVKSFWEDYFIPPVWKVGEFLRQNGEYRVDVALANGEILARERWQGACHIAALPYSKMVDLHFTGNEGLNGIDDWREIAS
jgi:hypothetical protein